MRGMDPAVRAAYERCRRLQRRHDPTYYWATRRLPEPLRPATHALYGYVRTADEIVDGPHRPPSPAARRAALDAWEAELRTGLRTGRSPHPVVGALVHAAGRHALPLEELGPYMRSMRVDCGPVRIGSWEELEAYMDGSAGSVGRIMAALLGVPERHRAGFGALGQAFQLTNFVRDLREDAALDRVYLPGADRAALAAGRATPELRGLVAEHVGRARSLFAAAEPAVLAAPASVRSGIRLACAAYARILDRAEAARYDVLGRAVGLRPWHAPAVLVWTARG
jgi:phytoene synthase